MSSNITFESIQKKVEYITKTLETTTIDYSQLLDAWTRKDYEIINPMRAVLSHRQYVEFLGILLSEIQTNIARKNHQRSKDLIYAFVEMFYLFKAGDFKRMKSIYNKFNMLCLTYADTFLNKTNKEILIEWNKVVNNIYEYSYEKIEVFFQFEFLDLGGIWHHIFYSLYNSEFFNIKMILLEIIQDSYTLIRQNQSYINDVYSLIDNFTYFFLENEFDSTFYHRVLSLIALKNDISLQQNLIKEKIDLYVEEAKYIYDNNLYYGQRETQFKILEILAKSQFAYNLLGIEKNLKSLFSSIHKQYVQEYFISPLDKEEYLSDRYQFAYIDFWYVFFLTPGYFSDNFKYKETYHFILNAWNEYKDRFYHGNTQSRPVDMSYQFIWE
jgi:hypothetical protein